MTEEKIKQFTEKIRECINNAQLSEYSKILDELMQQEDIHVAIILAQAFINEYTYFRADMIAKFMETAFRKKAEWGLVGGGKNPLWRSVVITGSLDLYDCYTEELKLSDDMLAEMYAESLELRDTMMKSYETVLKGRDFNSGVPTQDKVLINYVDYMLLNQTMEQYNSIVGRYQIISKLEEKI